MKTFIDICKMSQEELKKYLVKFLISKGYKPVSEDGFIYATPRKGKTEVPVLLVSHMDTVHKDRIKEIQKVPFMVGNSVETRISSPQGIGGDDRCGIYAIMKLIDEYNCYVLFAEDEEIGGVGSRKFTKTDYIKDIDINYMIEIDRKGFNDAVFYSCDNKDFTEWITTNTNFKKADGTFTDISTLMPEIGVAGVNFSSGYYNAHTLNEYVVEEELELIIDRIGDLLSLEIPKKFEYVRKTYSYGGYGSYGYNYGGKTYSYVNSGWTQRSLYDEYEDDDMWAQRYTGASKSKSSKKKKPSSLDISNTQIKLVVESDMALELYGDDVLFIHGNTKPECWMNLFMEYDELTFSMIDDYYYE